MSYVLSQFNQSLTEETDAASAENLKYMTILADGTPRRRKKASDEGVSGSTVSLFYDECLQFSSSLNAGTNYYVHAKIKRLSSDQIFYIYLVNYEEETGVDVQKT